MTRLLAPLFLLASGCTAPSADPDPSGIPDSGVSTGLYMTVERNGVVEAQYTTDVSEYYARVPSDSSLGCTGIWTYAAGDRETISMFIELPSAPAAGTTVSYEASGMVLSGHTSGPLHGARSASVRVDVWDDYRQFTLLNAEWCDLSTDPTTCGPATDTVVVTVETTSGDPWQVPGPDCLAADFANENQWFAGATTPMCYSVEGTPCP